MKKVLLLLSRGVEILEAAAFLDVLGWADAYGSEPIRVLTAGMAEEVKCTFGLTLSTDMRVGELQAADFDAVAVPGGFEKFGYYEDAYSEEFGQLIRDFNGQGKPIASICVGALTVARSGALEGRCATTYHLMKGQRRRELAAFKVKVQDQAIVCDENIITSTSPATAVEVALALLEKITSKENAGVIRGLMGF